MDSSHPQRITSRNRKRKAKNSMMDSCKRAKFMAKYYRQNFSMPDSVIYYIAKNPKTAELYLKMVKTCKYFFVKNPIIIIPNLYADSGKWRVNEKQFDLTKYNCKYWITDEIRASARGQNILSPIIPKLYRCDIECLYLSDHNFSFNHLSLLISAAEEIDLNNVIVKYEDSSDVPLEDIFAVAVKAYEISVTKPTITLKTMKELTKLSHFSKCHHFALNNLSEIFDIGAFYSYMKKNTHTKFVLVFDKQISGGYMDRLETIVDEILETKQFNYKPPFIKFTGLDIQKCTKLFQI